MIEKLRGFWGKCRSRGQTRVIVMLPNEAVEALKEIAEIRGATVTEALRQSIESQHFLQNEIDKGNRLLIENPNKKMMSEIIFPEINILNRIDRLVKQSLEKR